MSYEYFQDFSRDSNSSLKQFRKNRRVYRDIYITQERAPKKPTKDMLFGTAFHCAILEPDLFNDRYSVLPEGLNLRKKADQQIKKGMVERAAAAGGNMITKEDLETIDLMVAAVLGNEYGRWVVEEDGVIEEPVFWEDEATGLLMKCKPDKLIVSDEEIIIADFKKYGDEDFDRFGWACYTYQYDCQAALYIDGVRASLGLPLDFPIRFFIIPVSDCEPECRVKEFDAVDLENARRVNDKTQREIVQAKANDDFFNPSDSVIEILTLPRKRTR